MSDSVTANVQTITFNEIPYTWLVPGTYVEVRPNYTNSGVFAYPARALIIGQMLASGSATPNTVYQLISAAQARALFGNGSHAAEMAWAFLQANPLTRVDIIGVSDLTGGVQAAGAFTLTGAVTAAGTLPLYVTGRYVPVGVGATDTLATITTNAVAAINAMVNLPMVASSTSAGTIVLTAKHKGTIGNSLNLRVAYNRGDVVPSGLIVDVTQPTGGTGDPVLSGSITAVSSTWYTDVVLPFEEALWTAELSRRYTAMVKLDAHAYVGVTGSYGTLVAAGPNYNSQFRSRIALCNTPQSPWVWAASMAGLCTQRLTDDPGRQMRGTVMPGILAPADIDAFPSNEREILLSLGFTTFSVLADGTVALERVVTENVTDVNGIPTTAWQDIMAPKTMSRIRYDWITFIGLQYPANKLADDGSLAAQYDDTVVTPKRMSASWAGRSRLYEQSGWIENSAVTAAQSIFVRDASDRNKLNARQEVQRIGNLMVLAAALEFQV